MDGPLPRWSRHDAAALALVLAASALLYFSHLRAPLLEPQEGRYAEIPRLMLARGEWLVPLLNDQPYLDKPPLFYWSVMASYRALGVSDRSARVVPGLAGVATAAIVFLWGRRALGPRAGLLGAVILTLAPEALYRGRMLTFDALLTPCVAAGLAGAHLASLGRFRWGWWIASALACGLGLLAKGPVAPVLIAAPAALALWADRRLARPPLVALAAYLLVALAVAAPWYAALLHRHPEFAGYFFWKHNVERFVAPFDHAEPFWYYLPGLLAGLLPWALLLPSLARSLVRERPAALALPVIAFASGLLFFSLAGCKRPTYVLPLFPPLCLALGWELDRRAASLRAPDRLCPLAAAIPPAAALAAAAVAVALHFLAPARGLALGAVALAALAFTALAYRRTSWAATFATSFLFLLLGVRWLLPAYNDQFSLRGTLRREAAAGATRPAVVCYPQRFETLSFYLPDAPVRAFDRADRAGLLAHLGRQPDETLVLIKSGRLLEQFLADLPPGLELRGRSGGVALTVLRVARRTAPPVTAPPG